METLRSFQTLFLIGGILIATSVYMLVPASPFTDHHSFTLPPGGAYYFYVSFISFKAGQFSGHFDQPLGRNVDVYVFTQSEYDAFKSQSTPDSLTSSIGNAQADLSTSLPFPGTYYVVFLHGAGNEQLTEVVDFSYVLQGYSLFILALGLGLLATGGVLVVLGNYSRHKYQATAEPTASDVILFDEPQPPAPSQA